MAKRTRKTQIAVVPEPHYTDLLSGISGLLEDARRKSARAVNSILTATYWEIGRRIVEFEQGGQARAEYGESLLSRLSQDLSVRHGRGFSRQGLYKMRGFFLGWEILPTPSGEFEAHARLPQRGATAESEIFPTPSGKSSQSGGSANRTTAGGICPTASSKSSQKRGALLDTAYGQVFQTPSGKSSLVLAIGEPKEVPYQSFASIFPLSWSHYVQLLSVTTAHARAFYEAEAIRGGWSVRQLNRQIGTQFYERTSHSKRRAAMLAKGQTPKPEDAMTVEDEARDPYLLEFLDLKDEYSESELEEALIRHLEWFLLELGAGFTFVARQKRIRIGDTWYRIDLLLYHRGLRCLVIVDLKTGAFTHADAGQMGLYLNYAKRHLTMPDEADPVGIILCSEKDDAVVEYALGDMRANVFASKYLAHCPTKKRCDRRFCGRNGR